MEIFIFGGLNRVFSNSRQMIYRNFSPLLRFTYASITIFLIVFIAYESLIAVDAQPTIQHLDKFVHLGAYFVLGCLALPALSRIPPIFVALGLGLFGAGIEIAQGTMGIGRSADLLDGLANLGGALLAILAWAVVSAIKQRLRSPV